jgi:hypothetical protein
VVFGLQDPPTVRANGQRTWRPLLYDSLYWTFGRSAYHVILNHISSLSTLIVGYQIRRNEVLPQYLEALTGYELAPKGL